MGEGVHLRTYGAPPVVGGVIHRHHVVAHDVVARASPSAHTKHLLMCGKEA